jgi:subtilisin family serine protease
MPTFRLGRSDIDLQIVGAGLRNGVLPSPDREVLWDLSDQDLSDLRAFEEEGWRFLPQQDLDWREVRERNPGPVEAGLLGKHPEGGLVIVSDHLVVSAPLGLDSTSFTVDHGEVKRLPFGGNVYDIHLSLPDSDLLGTIQSGIDKFHAEGLDGSVLAEPIVVYHLENRGNLVDYELDPIPQWQWTQIELKNAWREGRSYGRPSAGPPIRVAIIDFGFHTEDAQIADRIQWTAYVDDSGTVVPTVIPKRGHGTLCASLAAGARDGADVNGAAPDCDLILVAIKSITTQVAVAGAITACTKGANGGGPADIISCSVGPKVRSWELLMPLPLALEDARWNGRGGLGIPIIWADFDKHSLIDSNSLENDDRIVCVGQNDEHDALATCGYGPGLDLIAPGDGVIGVVWSGGSAMVGPSSGASFAAPCAAGVAALILAARPDLHAKDVADILRDSCDPPAAPPPAPPKTRISDDKGWGRLNAWSAVKAAISFP